MLLSFFATSSAFAQDNPYNEEYTAQHDGVDRDEYLQEMEHSDPWLMSHRQMMPVFLLLIIIVRHNNKRTAVELNALPSYVNNNILLYHFGLWISL